MTKQEFLTKHTGNGDIARKDLDELIERYCREQREICSKQTKKWGFTNMDILNAPSPEL